MKMKSSKAVISVITLLVFLLVLVSCDGAAPPYINFEPLPPIINNSDRTLEPIELRVGESFNDMELIAIFYETDYDDGIQVPAEAHFVGQMVVLGIVYTCKETRNHYLIVDEEFREGIPTFNIERTEPYKFRILDLFEALRLDWAAFATDLILDPQFVSGRPAAFNIIRIISNNHPDHYDTIVGEMRIWMGN